MDSILGDDVLYLKKGEKARAEALLIGSVPETKQGDQGHLPSTKGSCTLGRVVGKYCYPLKWGLGGGGGRALRTEVGSSSTPDCQQSPGAALSGHLLW